MYSVNAHNLLLLLLLLLLLQCCYPLIDHLLAGGGDLMCTLTQCTDVAVHQDTTSLAVCLTSYTGLVLFCTVHSPGVFGVIY